METMQNLLEMKGITKRFPGVKALDGVELTIRPGEIHAVVGENGAGKSTLMKILLGIYAPDEGEIIWKGSPVRFRSPHDALSGGISMIHQEISLMPSTSVAENIWAGREHLFSRFGLIDFKKRDRMTREVLQDLGIDVDPRARVRTLRVAQMQLVELARAVSYGSDLIVMDEPTSALAETEIKLLFRIIRELADMGVSVIFISHKLDEVLEITHRVTAMRDGRYIATAATAETTEEDLIHWIVGRELKNLFPKQEAEIGDVALEVRNLSNLEKTVRDVSFSVRRGEILGLCGLVGAGRTETMRLLFGVDPLENGEILIGGEPVVIRSPRHAIAHGLGMVTEDRLRLGVLAKLPVRDNISIAYLRRVTNRLGFVNFRRESADSEEMRKRLQIKVSSIKQKISGLSGGNQQKAIIARWLLSDPNVLILDEPTRGIDIGSKAEIHRQVSQLAAQGMAIIMVSSELPEILGMSDRILVMHRGRIVSEYNRGEADQDQLMRDAFGTEARTAAEHQNPRAVAANV